MAETEFQPMKAALVFWLVDDVDRPLKDDHSMREVESMWVKLCTITWLELKISF